jgi:hypothetical protein
MNAARTEDGLIPFCPPLPEYRRGLLSLADLNNWERHNLCVLKTNSGRDLYYAIVMQFFTNPISGTVPLKCFPIALTEKAMRLRMKEFEAAGLIILHDNPLDHRSRSLTPTPKLYELYRLHSEALREIIKKRFVCVIKTDYGEV